MIDRIYLLFYFKIMLILFQVKIINQTDMAIGYPPYFTDYYFTY